MLLTKYLVTIDLIFRHGFIGASNSYVRASHPPGPKVIARFLGQIDFGYFGRHYNLSIDLDCREERPDGRLHLFALLIDLMLQVLSVIDADCFETALFIQSEDDNTATFLVREGGQSVI